MYSQPGDGKQGLVSIPCRNEQYLIPAGFGWTNILGTEQASCFFWIWSVCTPWKINMEPNMEVWKKIFLFNWEIFKFHLNYQGRAGLLQVVSRVISRWMFILNVSPTPMLFCHGALLEVEQRPQRGPSSRSGWPGWDSGSGNFRRTGEALLPGFHWLNRGWKRIHPKHPKHMVQVAYMILMFWTRTFCQGKVP